jgi:hypothetical protein
MYEVEDSLKGRDVWTAKGKIEIDKATDKQLAELVKLGIKGITKKEKPSKKKDEESN